MYKPIDKLQHSFLDFNQPMGLHMNPDNRWVRLADRIPWDKRASLTTENLQKIQIENEYDLQHLLYAVIKPLCPDARREVNDDSGVGTVRSDIKILSLNSVC